MRYAPSDRFWRNVLLTIALCVCTLGFSVANWNGSGLQLAQQPSTQGIEARLARAAAPVDLSAAKAEYAGSGGQLEPLGEAVTSVGTAVAAADDGVPQLAGSAGSRDFTGGRRPQYARGGSSSGSGSPGGLSGSAGGVGGGVWGAARSDKKAELVTKQQAKPKVNGRSGSKGGSKGNSDKNKQKDKSKPEGELAGPTPVGSPGAYDGSSGSPASTPEPLSMILVGTGLAGLYRARKYLS